MTKEQYEYPAWLDKWMKICVENGKYVVDRLPERQQGTMYQILMAQQILDEYHQQGYQLTLRQLYYQFVARDLIPNTDKNYKRLGDAVSHGRMWGLIDWSHLVDRGRNFECRSHWETPGDIIATTAHSFSVDRWAGTEVRFEVWVEKQALEDIVYQACSPFDVGYLACKGYMSQSERWSAAKRMIPYIESGQEVVLLHLGDHDPSGIDMTRDIQDRLNKFDCDTTVQRIALNMDQIEQYQPPPRTRQK